MGGKGHVWMETGQLRRDSVVIDEPKITINGKPLTSGQSMLVRVAVTSFHTEMQEPNALGDDEHGRAMVKGYRERAKEVLDLLLEQ